MSKKKRRSIIAITILVVLAFGVYVGLKLTIFQRFPELVENPKKGKWYEVTPQKAVCSTGEQWYALFRKGKENKVIVYFFGGGFSVDDYTAPRSFNQDSNGFYADQSKYQDFVARLGIGWQKDENPFKDWSILAIPYATGDFHCGTGDYPYIDLHGEEKVLYHHGYTNYRLALEEVKKHLGVPEALLITGYSAGGFGTAILADDVISQFPQTQNVTVFVDSSFLLSERWKDIASDIWKAPVAITKRLTTDNITLDCLAALRNDHGKNVKILFGSSVRDEAISESQCYLTNGYKIKSHETGDVAQSNLKKMAEGMRERVPGSGVFIWDDFMQDDENALTMHTILMSHHFYTTLGNKTSIAQWLDDAVNGKVCSFGLELLDKKY